MPIRHPIEYELTPKQVDAGTHWLTLRLGNEGSQELTGLDVRLNSLDAYGLSVFGTGSYIAILDADEERILPFQVSAVFSTTLYVSLDGWRDGAAFHWESPGIVITVGQEAAELVSLFAMTAPYPALGEKIRIEATVQGRGENAGPDASSGPDVVLVTYPRAPARITEMTSSAASETLNARHTGPESMR